MLAYQSDNRGRLISVAQQGVKRTIVSVIRMYIHMDLE